MEQAELMDNVKAWITHVKANVPHDVGAIVIFYNKRTGDVQGGASDHNRAGVVEVLRALANNLTGDGQNLVVPATKMPG